MLTDPAAELSDLRQHLADALAQLDTERRRADAAEDTLRRAYRTLAAAMARREYQSDRETHRRLLEARASIVLALGPKR